MSTVLERAKLHFRPQRTTPKKIHVPEWGDGEEGIFYATALNLKERQIIEKMAKDDIERGVEVVIRKLTDSEGKKVFTLADKAEILRDVDPRVISRIANEIVGETEIEEAEKN